MPRRAPSEKCAIRCVTYRKAIRYNAVAIVWTMYRNERN